MEKYKLIEVNEDIKELLGTKYDDLFEPRIKSRGIKYSILNKVNNISDIKGIVKAKVAGTSLTVEPASSLIKLFNGKDLVIINNTKTVYDDDASLVINEPLGKVFSKLK